MSKHVFVVSEWLPVKEKSQELWENVKKIMSLSRKEMGCIRAHATKQVSHPSSPGKSKYPIILLQEYIDLKAFDAHCKAEYVTYFFKNFIEKKETKLVADWRCRLFSEDE